MTERFPSRKPYKGKAPTASQVRDLRGRINARIDRLVVRIRRLETFHSASVNSEEE